MIYQGDRSARMWQCKCSKCEVVRSVEITQPIKWIEVPGCGNVSVVSVKW